MFKILVCFLLITFSAVAKEQTSISLFGIPEYQNNFTHFKWVNPDAPKGGEISFGAIGTFDNINPNILSGTAVQGTHWIYDSLLTRSSDEIMTSYGLVAKSLEILPDKKQVIFNLREIAKFYDGSQITSEDLVFSFNILMDKGHPLYKINFKDVEKVISLSKTKVAYQLKDISNKELIIKIGDLPILPKKFYHGKDFSKTTLEKPLSSGPYKIQSLKSGKYIIYERDKNYWGKDLAVNRGRYNFDLIRYNYYRDATVAIRALKAKEFQFRSENISKNWANEYNISEVENGEIIKEELQHSIPTGMQAFILNNRLAKFSDKKVRKALNLVFDFEWTNKNLFFDAYTRTNSFFSNSIFAAKGDISLAEKKYLKNYVDDDFIGGIAKEFKLPVTDGSGTERRLLLQARDLLKEAGWVIKDFELVHEKTGEKFTMEFLVTSPSFQRVILPYIRNLKKLGIEANIKMADYSQYQKRIDDMDFEVVVSVFPGMMIPGSEQQSFWHSTNADIKGSRNIVGIKNKVIDRLTENLIEEEDFAKRKIIVSLIDRILLNNYYVIPHWNINYFRLVYWNNFKREKYLPKYDLDLSSWWYSN